MEMIERIARVLAGQHYSRNAAGEQEHAADIVDAQWRDFEGDAVAVLKTMREPDAFMGQAGPPACHAWEEMIRAALRGADGRNDMAENNSMDRAGGSERERAADGAGNDKRPLPGSEESRGNFPADPKPSSETEQSVANQSSVRPEDYAQASESGGSARSADKD